MATLHRAFSVVLATSLLACTQGSGTSSSSSSSSGAPAAGTERGECFPNGTCFEGLVCLSNVCVAIPDAGMVMASSSSSMMVPPSSSAEPSSSSTEASSAMNVSSSSSAEVASSTSSSTMEVSSSAMASSEMTVPSSSAASSATSAAMSSSSVMMSSSAVPSSSSAAGSSSGVMGMGSGSLNGALAFPVVSALERYDLDRDGGPILSEVSVELYDAPVECQTLLANGFPPNLRRAATVTVGNNYGFDLVGGNYPAGQDVLNYGSVSTFARNADGGFTRQQDSIGGTIRYDSVTRYSVQGSFAVDMMSVDGGGQITQLGSQFSAPACPYR